MGRKRKYPTVCNCCQPPTELKDSDSAAYHKKVIMSKRSATEEAEASPPKKLSGLQQTVAAFVKECANGLLFDYFRNRPVAFEEIMNYTLEKFNPQERLAIYEKFVNLITEADKKVSCLFINKCYF